MSRGISGELSVQPSPKQRRLVGAARLEHSPSSSRRLGARTAGLLLAWLAVVRAVDCAEAAPAATEFELACSATGAGRSDSPGLTAANSQAVTLSWLSRHPLGPTGWYGGFGVQSENFSFASGPAWPRRLQDRAALLSLEYFANGEKVAALTVRPGWYFENRPTSAAWDVPVDLAAGIPITPAVAGAVGFSNGRFYHHALPIFGFIWTKSPQVRIEMVFPEPALVVTLSPRASLRLGGELAGGGFLSDPRPTRTVVEYDSYRVGAEWSGTNRSGITLTLGAGVEAERNFDFFRLQRRQRGSGAGYLKVSVTVSR